jgi:hypothetical protein
MCTSAVGSACISHVPKGRGGGFGRGFGVCPYEFLVIANGHDLAAVAIVDAIAICFARVVRTLRGFHVVVCVAVLKVVFVTHYCRCKGRIFVVIAVSLRVLGLACNLLIVDAASFADVLLTFPGAVIVIVCMCVYVSLRVCFCCWHRIACTYCVSYLFLVSVVCVSRYGSLVVLGVALLCLPFSVCLMMSFECFSTFFVGVSVVVVIIGLFTWQGCCEFTFSLLVSCFGVHCTHYSLIVLLYRFSSCS